MEKFTRSDEHSVADIGLTAEGSTLSELFSAAAKGMFAIMLENRSGEIIDTRTIHLHSDTTESLLVDWLSELLYLFDGEGRVPVKLDIAVKRKPTPNIEATVSFRKFDRKREALGNEIKAVTYYKLRVTNENGRNLATVVFDL
jgi:SHS2 domain-containing protein